MKSALVATLLILNINFLKAQDKIEWSPDVELTFADYQSSSSEINPELSVYSIGSQAGFEFFFQMTTYEFMFTKNFNNKVNTVFDRKSSYIVATSQDLADHLVEFGKLEFDLAELSARKFRKRLYEAKGAFSNTDFFKPLYDEIMAEQSERLSQLGKKTDLGRNAEILAEERRKVRIEIQELSDYCKTCKPPKKKKKKTKSKS
ncbi:hypothetical protein [Aureibacter tunicatorum]|uniref:Uncharacterized protein n=1 Tax=Aureibacter tunicatorum TaxID=866807 RepID=A0AAE3XIV5_9BACT|nr:hypothetical protein [Aureibacter tunicatorum]MDR6238551.1 hypothetical protein [Aureibacter tunicatorum]BDD05518.1 hypothetical protein AUTU_30010 [Aureibacter tunicatorum]